jgi:hypothetical protein
LNKLLESEKKEPTGTGFTDRLAMCCLAFVAKPDPMLQSVFAFSYSNTELLKWVIVYPQSVN